MAIIGGDQGKAGESKGSGRKADDLRLSCLCLLLMTPHLLSHTWSSFAHLIFLIILFSSDDNNIYRSEKMNWDTETDLWSKNREELLQGTHLKWNMQRRGKWYTGMMVGWWRMIWRWNHLNHRRRGKWRRTLEGTLITTKNFFVEIVRVQLGK